MSVSRLARMFSFVFHRRLHDLLAPRKPRHRALRIVLALFGIALLAVLLSIGLVIGAAMLIVGLLFRRLRRHRKPLDARSRTIESEYRVLRKPALTAGR